MWPSPIFWCRSLNAPRTSIESLACISRSRPARRSRRSGRRCRSGAGSSGRPPAAMVARCPGRCRPWGGGRARRGTARSSTPAHRDGPARAAARGVRVPRSGLVGAAGSSELAGHRGPTPPAASCTQDRVARGRRTRLEPMTAATPTSDRPAARSHESEAAWGRPTSARAFECAGVGGADRVADDLVTDGDRAAGPRGARADGADHAGVLAPELHRAAAIVVAEHAAVDLDVDGVHRRRAPSIRHRTGPGCGRSMPTRCRGHPVGLAVRRRRTPRLRTGQTTATVIVLPCGAIRRRRGSATRRTRGRGSTAVFSRLDLEAAASSLSRGGVDAVTAHRRDLDQLRALRDHERRRCRRGAAGAAGRGPAR